MKLGFVEKVEKVNLEFLKNNPTLVLDTKFFGEDFKYEVLSSIEDLEEKTNGLLINSENFQALNSLINKFKEKIRCCYIDPPYNTGSDGFLYKDGFNHSSWLSMMETRLVIAKELLSENGLIFISIDDNEFFNLKILLDKIFGNENLVQVVEVKSNEGAANEFQNPFMPKNCEYGLIYAKDYRKREYKPIWTERDWDKAYNKILLNPNEKDFSKWEIGTVNNELKKINLEDEKKITEWVIENSNRIFQTIAPKGAGSGLKKAMDQSKNNQWSIYERKELDDIYCYNGRMVRFYNKNIKDIDGKNIIVKEQGSLWTDIAWTGIAKEGLIELKNGKKPEKLLKRVIEMSSDENDYILDFFVGSGTTSAVAQKMNRKYIGIEMGEYFTSKTLVRLKNVLNGEQTGISKFEKWKGSGIFKYQKLEQYEDTLNNIDFKEQPSLIQESKDYHIKYMLGFESKENNVFLNLDGLDDPFNYKIDMFNQDNEKVETKVDLIETFNYIAGIEVKKINVKENKGRKYIIVKGSRNDNSIIVIWRNKKDNFNPQEDKDFIEKEILIDEQFDEIYTNGSSSVKDAKVLDEIFKSRLFVNVTAVPRP